MSQPNVINAAYMCKSKNSFQSVIYIFIILKVSYSNPVRQSLFEFTDCLGKFIIL